ncbi:MAG: NAD(P)-dependent oxidoreductase [Deltaproteobacteria bacterium]|nr:NAD(P)-dependent oxidoreductase [Deltaproteobacteria bacterium]
MKVLVTGAAGNVGAHTCRALLDAGHEVRGMDLPSRAARRVAARLDGAEFAWGDITNPGAIAEAVKGVQAIVHLAAVLPPASEQRPELAEAVILDGTRLLLEASSAGPRPPRFVLASSVAVYGARPITSPPVGPGDPCDPVDTYGRLKVQAEALVQARADSAVLRLGAVPPLSASQDLDPYFFTIPFENPIHAVHPMDAGRAFARAVEADLGDRPLLVAGGEGWRMTYGALVGALFEAAGVGALPAEAFRPLSEGGPAPVGWMDTTEAQERLGFQTRSLERYLSDLAPILGVRRTAARWLRPLARRFVLRLSPYL